MLDGIPVTAGATATIVSVTSPVPVNRPVQLTAKAPPGTTCEVEIFPRDAVLTPIPPQSPDDNGILRWSWQLNPKYVAGGIRVIVKCIERRGASELVNSTEAPNVQIVPAEAE